MYTTAALSGGIIYSFLVLFFKKQTLSFINNFNREKIIVLKEIYFQTPLLSLLKKTCPIVMF
jgi:hypothetical protein